MRKLCFCLLLLMLTGSVLATKSGGVIYMHDPDDTLAWSPLLCSSSTCQRVHRMVLPRLFGNEYSPVNDVSVSQGDDTVLTASHEIRSDGSVLLTLRDDLLWEDGTPVTAYDVFFTYLVFRNGNNQFGNSGAFLPLDATTLLIERLTPSCMLYTIQMTILPAHAMIADFAAQVAEGDFTEDEDASDQVGAWLAEHPWNAQAISQDPYHITMPITLMNRDMETVSPGDFLRVLIGTGDESVGLHIYSNLPTAPSVDYFLAGQLDLIREFPLNRLPDLEKAPGVTLYRGVTSQKMVLVFNLADPNKPNPYEDQFENRLTQEPHPILSDLAVRQAIVAAIDVNELIEVGLNGFGRPTNALFDFNSNLPDSDTPRFDPQRADQILTEAGWLSPAHGRDSVRLCQGCATAEPGTQLGITISFEVNQRTEPMMAVMRKQLQRVGFVVNFSPYAEGDNIVGALRSQMFELAVLIRNKEDANIAREFITENDGGDNLSSYSNETIDRLFKDVDNPSAAHACDATRLREIYAEAEDLLAMDLPQVTLLAFEEGLAVRDWVLHAEPVDPMYNLLLGIDDWQVYYGPAESDR